MNMLGELRMVAEGVVGRNHGIAGHIYTIIGAEQTKLSWLCIYIYI